VLIEDLHFAPEEGRALFASLAMAAPGHRILLVGTTRRGSTRSGSRESNGSARERTSLARLGPKDLARLLTDAFHSERLAEELAGKIGIKSDGTRSSRSRSSAASARGSSSRGATTERG